MTWFSPRFGGLLVLAAVVAAVLLASAPARSTAPGTLRDAAAQPQPDQVIRWNRILLGIVRTPGAQPATIHSTRSMAMLHAAVYDAVSAIDRSHALYVLRLHAPRHASAEAAAAQAAHDVLVGLYPNQAPTLDADLAASLEGVPGGTARTQGTRVGAKAAAGILALRAADGSGATPLPFTPGTGPGEYQPTPPAFAPPVFTHWPLVTPFALQSARQFRPPAPPPVASPVYGSALNEVKALGSSSSTVRDADQTLIGRFWSAPIQNYWNEIAQTVAIAHGVTLAEDARLFALLDLTLADAVIAFYDAKYAYHFWRPVTAVRAADEDGNPATAGDPTWTPLTNTAQDPSYPGAHAVVSAAAATVLGSFFASDADSFSVSSEVLPGVERTFTSFSAASDEAARSRIYAGQHFSFDETAGAQLGRQVAGWVLANLFAPRRGGD
jgi:hypothetical protein